MINKLSVETFILDVAEPLSFAPELTDFSCHLIDESSLSIDLHHDQTINQLVAEITKHNIQITSMRNKANRLEELFLGMINQDEQLPWRSHNALP